MTIGILGNLCRNSEDNHENTMAKNIYRDFKFEELKSNFYLLTISEHNIVTAQCG